MVEGKAEMETVAALPKFRDLQGQLGQAAQKHAQRGVEDMDLRALLAEEGAHPDGRDDADVKEDRRQSRHAEMAQSVEHGAAQRGQTNENAVRHHYGDQKGRQFPLRGEIQKRHGSQSDGRHHDRDGSKYDRQPGERQGSALVGLLLPLLLHDLGELRNENGSQGALTEEPSQKVRQSEGRDESGAAEAGAEIIRHQHVSHEAENAA